MNWILSFIKNFNNDTIRHIALNASQNEPFLRHPHAPLGITMRDQGQVDLYAGRTRMILSLKGEAVTIAKAWAIYSDQINFVPTDITQLKILKKHFNKSLFDGQQIAALKKPTSLKGNYVIGVATRWDEDTQQFINLVPLETVFEAVTIFESEEHKFLQVPQVEHFNAMEKLIGKVQ